MVSRHHLTKYNFWKGSTLVILFALCSILNAVGGRNRVEWWKQPLQKMTAAAPKLQVNLNLKPRVPSRKHESNVYLDVNTFYRRQNTLRSEKKERKGKNKGFLSSFLYRKVQKRNPKCRGEQQNHSSACWVPYQQACKNKSGWGAALHFVTWLTI